MLARRAVLGLALVTLAVPVSLHAQRLSIAPTIGVYIPTTELVKATSGEAFKQEIGLALGGRLGFAFSDRFGITATGSYVPSNLKVSFNGDQVNDANLFFGSARATFYVIPVTAPLWLSLNGGVGVVNRSGDYYKNQENTTDWTGVVGASAGVNLGGLGVFVSAEDYIYKPKFAEALGEPRTQNDVQLSIGLGVPLGR